MGYDKVMMQSNNIISHVIKYIKERKKERKKEREDMYVYVRERRIMRKLKKVERGG